MSNLPATNNSYTFWKRPEGTTGKVILSVIGIGAAYAFYHMLPFLITLAENTIYLAVLVGVLALLWIIVTSSRVHSLIAVGFEAISRAITEMFVDLDPIDILNTYSKQMHKKSDEMQESITQMQGVYRSLKGDRDNCNAEMNHAIKLADAADRGGDSDNANLQLEIVGRRQATLADLDQKLTTISDVLDALKRVQKVVLYHIASSDDEKKTLTEQLDHQRKMDVANKAANRVLGGNNDLDQMRAMAADNIRNRYNTTMGELDVLVESTKNMSAEVDLNQMVLRADGKSKLDELRKTISQAESSATPALTSGAAPVFGSGANVGVPVANRWTTKLTHND